MIRDTTLKRDQWKIVAVISGLSLVSVIVMLILTEQALAKQKEDILDGKTNTANVLSDRFQLRIEDAIKVLKIASNANEFATINNADSVSNEYKGIPFGLEPDKRKLADDVIRNYQNFETFAFVLPNGDIYFVEPYDRQLNLPRLNFADREWYKGAIETGQPFAADALISTATNHRVLPISVPVYADGSLKGMIVGAMDLGVLEDQLRKGLDLTENNRVVFLDDKGNAIEDVSETSVDTYSAISSMSFLQSTQNVINGQSGYLTESVNGVNTLVVYSPTNIGNRQWGIMLLQPVSDAYSSIDYLRNQIYVMLAIIVSIIGTAGYLLISFRRNTNFSKQLELANTELLKNEKLKDEFLKIASHELRTPIQPILNYAELGQKGLVNDSKAWRVVHSEARRLMRLANNILDISMAQSGTLSYNMQNTNLLRIVEAAIESVRLSAKDKQLELTLVADEKSRDVEVFADSSRLKRVLFELLDNAMKFTQEGGITVECKVENDLVSVTVRDTGTAIPKELVTRIFDLFSSKSASDPTIQGAGLGLFICRAIMKGHGGSISATNNPDGKGASFMIKLPYIQKPVTAEKSAAAS